MIIKQIKTSSAEERKVLLGYLLNQGYVWHKGSGHSYPSPEEIENAFPFIMYPVVLIKDSKNLSGSNGGHNLPLISFQEFIESLKKPDNKVELNSDLTAEVLKHTVKIGSYEFNHEAILRLVEKIKEIQNLNKL